MFKPDHWLLSIIRCQSPFEKKKKNNNYEIHPKKGYAYHHQGPKWVCAQLFLQAL